MASWCICLCDEFGCARQAVPLAEPEWSAAYKGLCLYIARVLQPAWEEAVTVPVSRGSSQQKANIPTATLQVAVEPNLFVHLSGKKKMRLQCSTSLPTKAVAQSLVHL